MIERTIVTRSWATFALQTAVLPALFALAGQAAATDAKSLPAAVDAQGHAVALPSPPEPLAGLIEIGNVEFEFYNPTVTKRAFAGETKFTFRYSYDSRVRWKLVRQQDQNAIQVSVRYRNVELQRTHRVLLPEKLLGPDLFSRALTLHEFDHVAISCDARLPGVLESMLMKRNATLVKVLDESQDGFRGTPTADDLSRISKRLVQEASDRVFDDFVAIVSIRYRELDRASDSGLKPLTPEGRRRIVESPPEP
ncbi:MAG: hypothetical protein ACO1RT_09730 [Planctomycetaceae bacterium]